MLTSILLATGATIVVWFVLAGALYENPITKSVLAGEREHPGVRRWASQTRMLVLQLAFGVGVPSLVFAGAYALVRPALPTATWAAATTFGALLIGLRVLPRLADMALLSTYPRRHLVVDTVNGVVTSLAIATTLVFVLPPV